MTDNKIENGLNVPQTTELPSSNVLQTGLNNAGVPTSSFEVIPILTEKPPNLEVIDPGVDGKMHQPVITENPHNLEIIDLGVDGKMNQPFNYELQGEIQIHQTTETQMQITEEQDLQRIEEQDLQRTEEQAPQRTENQRLPINEEQGLQTTKDQLDLHGGSAPMAVKDMVVTHPPRVKAPKRKRVHYSGALRRKKKREKQFQELMAMAGGNIQPGVRPPVHVTMPPSASQGLHIPFESISGSRQQTYMSPGHATGYSQKSEVNQSFSGAKMHIGESTTQSSVPSITSRIPPSLEFGKNFRSPGFGQTSRFNQVPSGEKIGMEKSTAQSSMPSITSRNMSLHEFGKNFSSPGSCRTSRFNQGPSDEKMGMKEYTNQSSISSLTLRNPPSHEFGNNFSSPGSVQTSRFDQDPSGEKMGMEEYTNQSSISSINSRNMSSHEFVKNFSSLGSGQTSRFNQGPSGEKMGMEEYTNQSSISSITSRNRTSHEFGKNFSSPGSGQTSRFNQGPSGEKMGMGESTIQSRVPSIIPKNPSSHEFGKNFSSPGYVSSGPVSSYGPCGDEETRTNKIARPLGATAPAEGSTEYDNKRHSNPKIENGIRVAIVKEGFPNDTIRSTLELGNVQGAINSAVDSALITGAYIPMIRDTYIAKGAVIVVCEDKATENWLKERVPYMKSLEGSNLTTVSMDALQKFKRVALWIPGPPSPNNVILIRLDRLNPGLKTGLWRVVSRREVVSKGSPAGVRLVASIDKESLSFIESKSMKIYCGIGMASVTSLTQSKNF